MVPVDAGFFWPRYQLPSAAWYTRYITLSKPRTGAPRVIALATFSWLPPIHWGCSASVKRGLGSVPAPAEPGLHADAAAPVRSEEHTAELQSHSELVRRLLSEKKN